MIHTHGFYQRAIALCENVEASPFDMFGVWMAESGVSSTIYNPAGFASGVNQLMPATAKGMGWDPDDCSPPADSGRLPLARYRAMPPIAQLEWVERYYRPYKGRLKSAAAAYCATFLPADIDLAANPDAVLVQRDGRRGWAYAVNASFDVNHDYCIRVHELTDAIERNCTGPRWNAIRAELRMALGLEPGPPDTVPTGIDLRTTLGVQRALSGLGYNPGPLDGVPGVMTRAALVQFQQQVSLADDGVCGPRSRAALQAALAAQMAARATEPREGYVTRKIAGKWFSVRNTDRKRKLVHISLSAEARIALEVLAHTRGLSLSRCIERLILES